MSDADVSVWMQKVRDGWDETLKGMLIALAPKVDRVNFIAYQGEEYDDMHPLSFLCQAIRSISTTPEPSWPPGFRSLRHVSICTSTTMRHPHDAYYASPSAVAPLFFLPNIKVLNLTLLGYHDDEDEDYSLPAGCSSVEELAFSCCNLSHTAMGKLIKACKRLRGVKSMASCSDKGNLTGMLYEEYGHCLEDVFLYGAYETVNLQGLRNFRRLKSLNGINVSTLLSNGDESTNARGAGETAHQPSNAGSAHVIDLRDLLPPSIESIALIVNRKTDHHVHRELLRTVADLVEDERFAQLKEVCMWSVAVSYGTTKERTFDWDPDALERIKAKGVDLHCIGNNGGVMKFEEHAHLHPNPNDGLTEVETDPRHAENQRV
ncbi:hypothetical protein LTR36_006670 [Oleoguttula mirabilis]|uniref:Uncharacterized protein n=1 Tax=Oleoguttula mirabilis TaxID=1507867 RepID=A0AAV9JC58_9PEZI|nr:hypothetical protein LTR36_006670 [Oleoguttula mirabilis]